MKCPYCGEEMVPGHIETQAGHPAFWLPHQMNLREASGSILLSVKRVEASGGKLLGRRSIPFFPHMRPFESMRCRKCDILITPL